jgi:hypothetical protein
MRVSNILVTLCICCGSRGAILGADYRKVETLAGQHFEAIAVQEAENAWVDGSTDTAGQPTPIDARLEYAKNYMSKIVNMRLDLPHPVPKAYVNLIRQVGETGSNARTLWQQALYWRRRREFL